MKKNTKGVRTKLINAVSHLRLSTVFKNKNNSTKTTIKNMINKGVTIILLFLNSKFCE